MGYVLAHWPTLRYEREALRLAVLHQLRTG